MKYISVTCKCQCP